MTLYCWGSTINGELGCGGVEEEHVRIRNEKKTSFFVNFFFQFFLCNRLNVFVDSNTTGIGLVISIKYRIDIKWLWTFFDTNKRWKDLFLWEQRFMSIG